MSDVSSITTVLGCKNSMLREGLRHILSNTRYRVHPEDLAQHAKGLPVSWGSGPLMFLFDPNLFPAGLAEEIHVLKEEYPDARVVLLADTFDLDAMLSALQAGADGYCLATIGCEALIKYLDLVMLGEVVFPSAMCLAALTGSDRMAERLSSPSLADVPQAAPRTEAIGSPVRILSSREAEILQCLMQGAPNKVIARKLEVAEATVKVHIKAILRKIRVANRTQAAMWAVAHLPAASASETVSLSS